MTITVQELLSRVSDDISKTISATSTDPTLAIALRYYNRVVDSIGQVCVRYKSDLAKATQTITTVEGTAEYADLKDTMHAPEKWGYITISSTSKSIIRLISEQDSLGYGFASGQYAQPEAFYVNHKNYIVFCSTPDDAYSISIPYWKKFQPVSALSYTVTGASKADPCVITCASHPFKTDDRVYFASVGGMTELNSNYYDATYASSSTFSLQNIDSSSYTTYTSGGSVYPCVPFNGIFDNLITQMVTMLLFNREEYDIGIDSAIASKIEAQVLDIIGQRKKTFRLKVKGYRD